MTDTTLPRLGAIVLDCPDPVALADFYAQLLGWTVAAGGTSSWVTIEPPDGGAELAFQQADDYVTPSWPQPDVPQQLHLDLTVDDLEAAHERAVTLGARLLDEHDTYRVYADPAGHPFCLCAC